MTYRLFQYTGNCYGQLPQIIIDLTAIQNSQTGTHAEGTEAEAGVKGGQILVLVSSLMMVNNRLPKLSQAQS